MRAHPPAPTKTNFARMLPGVRPIERRYLTPQVPSSSRLRLRHLGVRAHVRAVVGEVREELTRQGAEVDIGARRHASGRERLALAALLHEQRRPFVDDAGVLAVLDAGEQRLVLERLVALLEERDILLAPHERHVRRGVDEGRRLVQHALLHERRPELAALLELLVDRDRLGGVDRAVLALGRVVQLAERGVARSRVVPGVRALERRRREAARRRRSSSPAAVPGGGCPVLRS